MTNLEEFRWDKDAEWIRLEETVSTNTFLKNYKQEEGRLSYIVVTTQFQTAGRGQRGNSWESEAGKNLLFSIAEEKVPVAPQDQFFISELISCSIVSMLQERFPAHKENFKIKWPNDIYWRDKKLAGILIEHELTDSHIARTIIGVGLNVNQETFVSNAPNPVSLLQITGEETSEPELLLHDLLTRYANVMLKYPEDSTYWQDHIRCQYHSMLYRKGILACYQDAEGSFEAVLEEVEPNGMLRLRDCDSHIRRYAFKEVSYIL
ncbi:MAG: biotin--[acetyl-CoA-carboxylase] ligase [Bacteroidaceae bacterium]|nr:biotin--[acetyl-CoA-carboxylase] ligase [Bacteroidaceae bacterium]